MGDVASCGAVVVGATVSVNAVFVFVGEAAGAGVLGVERTVDVVGAVIVSVAGSEESSIVN
jgi:hypothetical protein